ncbi:hypothetical protein ABPG72_018980 [Tetrahymena utriculariae]
MSLQTINDSFINFIEQKQIDIPEDFIQIFSQSLIMDQWIDSETVKKYLQYERQEQLGRSLRTFFKENYEFKEITRQEFDKIKKIKDNKSQHGGQNKKFYLLSPDSFKKLLLLRRNEYGEHMITLEKIFREFMIQQQLQEKDRFDQQIYKYNIIKIYKAYGFLGLQKVYEIINKKKLILQLMIKNL